MLLLIGLHDDTNCLACIPNLTLDSNQIIVAASREGKMKGHLQDLIRTNQEVRQRILQYVDNIMLCGGRSAINECLDLISEFAGDSVR